MKGKKKGRGKKKGGAWVWLKKSLKKMDWIPKSTHKKTGGKNNETFRGDVQKVELGVTPLYGLAVYKCGV